MIVSIEICVYSFCLGKKEKRKFERRENTGPMIVTEVESVSCIDETQYKLRRKKGWYYLSKNT